MLLFIQILILSSVGYLATEIYLPSLPYIAKYFNVSNAEVQYSLASFFLGFGLIPIVVGPISDKLGRKKLIITGIIIGLIATIAIALSNSILQLIIFRFFQGIGFGIAAVLGRVIIPDLYSGKELNRINSLISVMIPAMLGIGPLIGGFIQEYYEWRMVFWIIAVYSLLILGLIFFKLPETLKPQHKNNQNILKIYSELLTNNAFILFLVCTTIPFIIVIAWLTVLPFVLQEKLMFSPSMTGIIFLISIFIEILGGLTNIWLIERFKHHMILLYTCILFSIVTILMIGFYIIYDINYYTVLIPGAFAYFIIAIIFPNGYHLAFLQLKKHFGSASGLMTTSQLLGSTIVTTILGIMTESSLWPLIIILSITAILYIVTLIFVYTTETIKLD